ARAALPEKATIPSNPAKTHANGLFQDGLVRMVGLLPLRVRGPGPGSPAGSSRLWRLRLHQRGLPRAAGYSLPCSRFQTNVLPDSVTKFRTEFRTVGFQIAGSAARVYAVP